MSAYNITKEELVGLDMWWNAANYLTACQLYLLENPLLEKPLTREMIKRKIVGHWGTCPGQNFIYTHLNRMINKYDIDMIYLSGPGHGIPPPGAFMEKLYHIPMDLQVFCYVHICLTQQMGKLVFVEPKTLSLRGAQRRGNPPVLPKSMKNGQTP